MARGDPEGERLAHNLRSFWREEGLVATTAGSAEMEAAELRGDQVAAYATYRQVVDTLTSIWHPLFQARVRLAATTLAAFASGARHTAAPPSGRPTRRSSPSLVDDAHAVLERRNEKSGTSWGPESLAWESRVDAELLRWRWAADIDPPSPEELVGRLARRRVPVRDVRRALRARLRPGRPRRGARRDR